MSLIFLLVAVAVTIAVIAVATWLFARAFAYVAHKVHAGIVFSVHLFSKSLVLSKPALVSCASATRSVKAVIASKIDSKRSAKADAKGSTDSQERPFTAAPEINWDEYDVPTFIRQGKILSA